MASSPPTPARDAISTEIVKHLRDGFAVKVVGSRGMGKSVLLQQIYNRIEQEPGTRALLVPGPPEDATVRGALHDLAVRLGIDDFSSSRVDDLLDRVFDGDVTRLVILFDEADQYAAAGSQAAFARSWFDKLEVTRKDNDASFNLVFAGGLGLFYLEHELGSALVSRAKPCVLEPFSPEETAYLAGPFAEDERPLDEACLATLMAVTGGSPALVTYGLQRLWERSGSPVVSALEHIFGLFREEGADFIRAVRASVSQRGRLDAPWRVLEVVRANAGMVPMDRLRNACIQAHDERIGIDPQQALKLLQAAGLVKIEGSPFADPVAARPIASILNLPDTPAGSGDPIERLLQDISAILANLHCFGRDFHGKAGLLHEELYSSMIAVGLRRLRLLGWAETDREAIQAAGFTDIKVRLVTKPKLGGHVILETKLWRGTAHNKDVQKQIDDYRIEETLHGIVVTLGERATAGWPTDYERTCLAGRTFEQLPTPRDLVGRWRVQTTLDGHERFTDHLLVQIPKRR
jgi:hypothetical protein